jgi:hypothetical protein
MDQKSLKKNTVEHSISDVTPRNKKKSSIRPGYYMRGLPVEDRVKMLNLFILGLPKVSSNLKFSYPQCVRTNQFGA